MDKASIVWPPGNLKNIRCKILQRRFVGLRYLYVPTATCDFDKVSRLSIEQVSCGIISPRVRFSFRLFRADCGDICNHK